MMFSTLAIINRFVRLRDQKKKIRRGRPMVTTVGEILVYWSGQRPNFSELNNYEMKLREQFHL